MKTIGGSSLKLFSCRQSAREGNRAQTAEQVVLLGHWKRVRVGLSLGCKSIYSIPAPLALSSTDSQTGVESEEISNIDTDQPKTVRVRFKLQKECAFGQQFLIVGNDSVLGLWDPSYGVPLNWTDGHVWTTAEMDIPIGTRICYKFILMGGGETMLWQPGPDRVLETWDTDKTITVFEDWDKPELQNIVEEEMIANLDESSTIDLGLSNNDENLNQPLPTDVKKELAETNGSKELMVAENITDEPGRRDLTTFSVSEGSVLESTVSENNCRSEDGRDFVSEKGEARLVTDEVVPVLVPGLDPTPTDDIEEALQEDGGRERIDNSTSRTDEVELNVPEMGCEGCSSSSSYPPESIEETIGNRQLTYGEEQLEDSILEGDMQWGRRTLQKFLASLGFQTS